MLTDMTFGEYVARINAMLIRHLEWAGYLCYTEDKDGCDGIECRLPEEREQDCGWCKGKQDVIVL